MAEFARREIADRYTGQILGVAWAIITPAAYILVFLFIFGAVFKLKVAGDSAADLTVFLVSGLIPWLVFQDCLGRAPGVISAQAHLVKQVTFPIEVLPYKSVAPALLTLIVGEILLLGYVLLTTGQLPVTFALLPLLCVLLLMLCVGFTLILSAIGVFLRDLKDVVNLVLFVGIYLAPVFYSLDKVPDVLRPLVLINPFTYVVIAFQDATFTGAIVHPWAWGIFSVLSIVIYWVGVRLFALLRPFFGSYL
jgi:lipopolysaccharide transport system permease protein